MNVLKDFLERFLIVKVYKNWFEHKAEILLNQDEDNIISQAHCFKLIIAHIGIYLGNEFIQYYLCWQ